MPKDGLYGHSYYGVITVSFSLWSWSASWRLVFVCLFVPPFPMHHTSKCLPDTGPWFASLSEVELSSSREEERGASPEFGLPP